MTEHDRLVCERLTKSYRGGFRLGPLTMEVATGVTCLVGPNGAGKSTFFRLAAGVDRPSSGSIGVVAETGRAGLGYLPQEPKLPNSATCEEFLHHVAWLQRMPRRDRAAAASHALDQVGLSDRRNARIGTLSGGMRRRLGIAHALVHDPLVLLLDEPTVGLDPRQRIALREAVAAVSRNRIVIVSTHLVEDVRGLADRVVILGEGQVAYDGDVASLEAHATDDAPGDTDLERAIAVLMTGASE
ncbi:ATP-binding cassette domain-containing protein [Catellatospora citrea]|uniref:ATP-binding cassette domain-containing protein n=1 Tax=Catellatospora citrea TaxID=53366 RepID=UPI00340EA967